MIKGILAAAFAVSLAWSGTGAVAAPAAAAPIATEDFAQLPFLSDPVMSPDGTRIAARITSDGEQRLVIYDLNAKADAPPRFVPSAGLTVRWFSWAGNDRLLVGHMRTMIFMGGGMFGILPSTRIRSYDLKKDKPLDLDVGSGMLGDDVIYTDPWGRFVLVSAQHDWDDSPSVQRVDLDSGARVEVQAKSNGIWKWFADDQGMVRGGVSYASDGKGFSVYYRDAPDGPLKKAGKSRVDLGESAVDSVALIPGSDKGVIVTNAVTGRFGVYELLLGENGGVGAPIFEHPSVDVKEIRLSPDGRRVDAAFYEDERPHVKWFAADMAAVQAEVDRTFPGKDNRLMQASRDGNFVLLRSGSADDPGTYYVFDRKGRKMITFASPYEKLVDRKFSPVKPIRYAARDGLSIPAYLTLPAGREAKALPLIVMPHGGPFARDSYSFDPWVQFLADRGYAVLQPQYRGSTGYGRQYVEKGYGAWGMAMQDDLDDGVAELVRLGIADPKRVCLMGASYGGYAALWGAIRNPETYRCAISLAGVTDLRAMLDWDKSLLVASRYSKQWRQRVEGEKKRDLAAISPLKQAARLKVPVLLAHGTSDSNVPFSQGRDMAAALKAAGAETYVAWYRGEGHGFEKNADALDFLNRVEAFLTLYNPADGMLPTGAHAAVLVGGSVTRDDYPSELVKKKEQGKADLTFTIARDGRPAGCRAERSSGNPKLDQLACDLVRERLQYRPASGADGKPVEAQGTYSVDWTFPDPKAKPAEAGAKKAT